MDSDKIASFLNLLNHIYLRECVHHFIFSNWWVAFKAHSSVLVMEDCWESGGGVDHYFFSVKLLDVPIDSNFYQATAVGRMQPS
jgi:hypothetical protein